MELSELLSSIGAEDMEKLKKTAQGLLGGGAENKPSPLDGIDPRMLEVLGKTANLMSRSDPRCDLLTALKPLLGEARRARVDDAVRLLRMSALLPQVLGQGGRK
ncbi:MAG: hypothetical protein IJK23_03075 [Clostridia bacterium]|nr:hypothetical protein [Clostridia bacterium]